MVVFSQTKAARLYNSMCIVGKEVPAPLHSTKKKEKLYSFARTHSQRGEKGREVDKKFIPLSFMRGDGRNYTI
jgi:hypothetical protein